MTPPVPLALGPQIDYPGSLPNALLTRHLADVLHAAGVPVQVLTEDGRAGWPQGVEVVAGSCTRPAETLAASEAVAAMFLAGADLRVGGRWRWVMVTDEGYEVGFHGEYREIVPNRRIVNTEAFEGFPEPDAYSVNTLTLVEHDGRTTMTVLVEHQRPEHRDAHINSGMEGGMQDAYDLLEEAAIALGAEA